MKNERRAIRFYFLEKHFRFYDIHGLVKIVFGWKIVFGRKYFLISKMLEMYIIEKPFEFWAKNFLTAFSYFSPQKSYGYFKYQYFGIFSYFLRIYEFKIAITSSWWKIWICRKLIFCSEFKGLFNDIHLEIVTD